MKKTRKIILLYLLFGIGVAIVISLFGGGYRDFVADPVKFAMTIGQYLILMSIVALTWFPLFVLGIFIAGSYLAHPLLCKLFFVLAIGSFIVISIFISKKQNTLKRKQK